MIIRCYGLGLPGITGTDAPAEVRKRADEVSEGVAGNSVAIGAALKLAGRASGYEFDPMIVLDKDQTARGLCAKLSPTPEKVLLVRYKAGNPQRVNNSLVLSMVSLDAALFSVPSWDPVFNSGFLGVVPIDPKEITGDKVNPEYLFKQLTQLVAKEVDSRVLAEIQANLDRTAINAELARCQGVPGRISLSPATESLEGGDEMMPELTIIGKAGAKGVVYWQTKAGTDQRRWRIGGGEEVNTVLKPAAYMLYVDIENGPNGRKHYRADVDVVFKKRYVFKIE